MTQIQLLVAIATMHDSVFAGDGKRAIQDFALVLRQVYGKADS
ncbi:hypothetical protein [Nostoc sp. FACHB-133]|nr:hypothetical protein [Nostoc sp. FACHB-133]